VADQLRTQLSPDLAVRTVSRFKVSARRGFVPVALIEAGRRLNPTAIKEGRRARATPRPDRHQAADPQRARLGAAVSGDYRGG
jgi:hypothetical protein